MANLLEVIASGENAAAHLFGTPHCDFGLWSEIRWVQGWVTLTVIVPEIRPLKPGELAVIKMLEQMLAPEVMNPVLVTVTHCVAALCQLTSCVMSRVIAGWSGCV